MNKGIKLICPMQLWINLEKSIIFIIIKLCIQEYNIIKNREINIAMLSNHLNHFGQLS